MNCSNCGAETITGRIWQAWTPEQRVESGARRREGETCARCYYRKRRGGIDRKTWPLDELIEEAEFQFGFGASVKTVAEKLGIAEGSLYRAYYRGRKKGLTTRKIPYSTRKRAQ